LFRQTEGKEFVAHLHCKREQSRGKSFIIDYDFAFGGWNADPSADVFLFHLMTSTTIKFGVALSDGANINNKVLDLQHSEFPFPHSRTTPHRPRRGLRQRQANAEQASRTPGLGQSHLQGFHGRGVGGVEEGLQTVVSRLFSLVWHRSARDVPKWFANSRPTDLTWLI
jgi:hypothetical protein